jgi:hypothetical protein
LNLLAQFLLCFVDGLNALLYILIELSDLVLKSLLVLLILLLMLALDDFLSLLCDTIHLDILSALLEVQDLKIKLLLLIADLSEEGLEFRDLLHLFDFGISSLDDFLVLSLNYTSLNENSILIIGSHRKLWDLNLSLLQVNYNLVVIF